MEEKREAYLEWIKEYCNNSFADEVPLMVDVIIDEMMEFDKNVKEVVSEQVGDYSVSFSYSEEGYPKKILTKLKAYKKNDVILW